MTLVLTEDQTMLQDSAKAFCTDQSPVSVMRRLRDSKDSDGYDKTLWKQMVELGWTGMTIPEQFGGYNFGYGGLGLILEETGRTLVSSPLISTVLLCSTAINLICNDQQKSELLPAIVSGELLMALALDESPFHQPKNISCEAKALDGGFALSGTKTAVLDGHIANKLIVAARTEQGITLFIVDSNAEGVEVQRNSRVDSRNSATITFNQTPVDSTAILGELDQGFKPLDQVLDIARIGLSAEMLGSIQVVFDAVVQYLKDRKQFGIAIGAFQALQHRAAEMYSEIELCKSLVRASLSELDNGSDLKPSDPKRIAILASATKAKLSETFFTVSNEGVQMHGGIGMTDEFDIGFYLKRARVAQHCLGDEKFHRDRYATLNGF